MSLTEERYARATRSSHLEVAADQRGDIDSIIAAGGADSLGVILARVRAEWDGQAGELALYQQAQADQLRQAREHADLAQRAKDDDVAAGHRDAVVFHTQQAQREAITGRAMVMMNMPTLRIAKQALLGFAVKQALVKKINTGDDAALFAMLGNVLDTWVDRKCHHCGGRGFNGGYRQPQVHCRPCRGTGNRRMATLSENPNLHGFGLWLLNVLDSKAQGAMGQINRKTRINA
ncbi:hypothetical protein [Roseateles sp. YR242]|uniref:hypothetical protein n=1 Tax=Roseateles sp. YR242 TaxID=1855305 RepID=UPI000B86CFD7|nr:hypothetical protein [Roseateles sp. YR242]